MKSINKLLLLSLFGLLVASCTDLEENLRGDVTNDITREGISTSGPADVLGSAYGGLRNAGTANHGSYFSLQEITSDEMVIGAKGGDWFDGGILIQLHRHTYTPAHDFVNNALNGTYGAINTCNELLAGATLDDNQTAQIRALRAYFYMRLCDMFGNVKIITAPGSDAPQVDRATVFDFVESELLASLGVSELTQGVDLSNSPLGYQANTYRINTYGALGILSKLYLNAEVWRGQAMYDKSAIASSIIIDQGPYALCGAGCTVANLGKRPQVASDPDNLEGYAAVFAPNNAGNPEHIFSIFYDEVAGGGMNFSQMCLHYGSQFTWNLDEQPWNGYATLEDLYNSYEDGDLRKSASFLSGPQTDFSGAPILDYASDDEQLQLVYTPQINELEPNYLREAGVRPAKFNYKLLGRQNMDNDFPVVRLGEIYLNRAEAMSRMAGDWNVGLADVNMLRARAGVSAFTSMTGEQFLAERGREMFQDASRRTDLIRFGTYNDAWWEKPVSQPFVNLFPIPTAQLQATAGGENPLSQNPGY